jgi:hypothetical protein
MDYSMYRFDGMMRLKNHSSTPTKSPKMWEMR